MHRYKIVKTWQGIRRLVKYCKATRYCSHDFETTGLEYYDTSRVPTTIAISFQPGSAYVIPLCHPESPFKKEYAKVLTYLDKHLFRNPLIVKVGHNVKFENKWLIRYGCDYEGPVFDTMLAKHLLDEERPHGLKELVSRFIPEFDGYEDEVGVLAKQYGWDKIPLQKLAKYNALDADLTLRLMIRFEPKLIKGGFYKLFRNLFMPLSSLIAHGEYRGIPVDTAYLDGLVETYGNKIAKLEKALRLNKYVMRYEKYTRQDKLKELIDTTRKEAKRLKKEGRHHLVASRETKISQYLAGVFQTKKDQEYMQPINFGSAKQLIDLFFYSDHGFKLPIIAYTENKATKQRTTTPSVSEETLLKLEKKDKTNFIKTLLELRGLQKLYSTYVVGVQKLVDSQGLIHANFKIHGTVTGRMSCTEPNLQNIPRGTTASDIKQMFIAPKGYAWVEVDYSQAELRVVAEVANDEAMIEIFQKNYNIHVATACKMNGGLQLYDKVKSILANPEHPENIAWEKRKKAGKVLNFSVLYMQSDNQTAEQMGVPKKEAGRFKAEWFKQFSAIKPYIDNQYRVAREVGYVKTMFGMKRRLPNIYSPVQGIRFEAHRQSVNAPIQGTASQFTLFSMVIIDRQIKSGELPPALWMYNVHDSIGYLVPVEHVHKFIQKVVKICANPETQTYFGFEMKKVSMKVSPEVGSNWGNVADYDPWKDYSKLLIAK